MEVDAEYLSSVMDRWSTKQKHKKRRNKKANEAKIAAEKAVIFLGEASAALINENEKKRMYSSSDESDIEIVEPPAQEKIGKILIIFKKQVYLFYDLFQLLIATQTVKKNML